MTALFCILSNRRLIKTSIFKRCSSSYISDTFLYLQPVEFSFEISLVKRKNTVFYNAQKSLNMKRTSCLFKKRAYNIFFLYMCTSMINSGCSGFKFGISEVGEVFNCRCVLAVTVHFYGIISFSSYLRIMVTVNLVPKIELQYNI